MMLDDGKQNGQASRDSSRHVAGKVAIADQVYKSQGLDEMHQQSEHKQRVETVLLWQLHSLECENGCGPVEKDHALRMLHYYRN